MRNSLLYGLLLVLPFVFAGCEPAPPVNPETPAKPETPTTPTTPDTPAGEAWSWFDWTDYINAENGDSAWTTPFPGVPHLLSFCNWAKEVFPDGIPNSPLGSNSGSDWKLDEWKEWATQNGTIDTGSSGKTEIHEPGQTHLLPVIDDLEAFVTYCNENWVGGMPNTPPVQADDRAATDLTAEPAVIRTAASTAAAPSASRITETEPDNSERSQSYADAGMNLIEGL